jgi:hypothetical protein
MGTSGRTLTALLLLLTSSISPFAAAQEIELTSQEKVGIGLMHALKNEKKQAWEFLFPEAKAGNVDAMFHLGQLMSRSPEYKDHLQRAKTFFTAAAKLGHKGAQAMLLNVDKQLAMKSGTTPTIAGKSALPTPDNVMEARRFRANYEQSVGRFIDDSADNAQAKVHVFISNELAFADDVADLQVKAQSRYGDRVAFKYHVVIDQKTWKPSESFKPNSEPRNMIGFEPDMNGQQAIALGVRRTPAIAIETRSGTKKLISGPNQLNSELAGILE